MKITYLLLLIVLFTLICQSAFAQGYTPGKLDQKFQVHLKDGTRFYAINTQLTDSSAVVSFDQNTQRVYTLDQIKKIEKYAGHETVNGTFIGAAFGGGIIVLYYALVDIDIGKTSIVKLKTEEVLPTFVKGVSSGTIIGLIAGALTRKWEDVPLNPSLSFKTDNDRKMFCLHLNF